MGLSVPAATTKSLKKNYSDFFYLILCLINRNY